MSATDREREVMDMFSDDPGAFMREVRDWFTLNPEATVRREAGIRDIMLRHFGDEARELFDWQPPDDPASCCAQRPGPMELRALTRAQCYANCRAGGTACLMRCSGIPYLPLRLACSAACAVAVLGCRARCRRITPEGGTASSLLNGNP